VKGFDDLVFFAEEGRVEIRSAFFGFVLFESANQNQNSFRNFLNEVFQGFGLVLND